MPAMEWSPPYNWREPKRTKEEQIQQAIQAAREQFGDRVTAIVPVCAAAGKIYGVDQEILPAVASRLGEARTVALLRCLKAEADTGKVRKLFRQLFDLGVEATRTIWQNAIK
jgi:predicted GTPase